MPGAARPKNRQQNRKTYPISDSSILLEAGLYLGRGSFSNDLTNYEDVNESKREKPEAEDTEQLRIRSECHSVEGKQRNPTRR